MLSRISAKCHFLRRPACGCAALRRVCEGVGFYGLRLVLRCVILIDNYACTCPSSFGDELVGVAVLLFLFHFP